MAIFIDAQTLADLSNYDGLNSSVAKWLERDDLTDQIPDFIKLAEARFRDVLVMPDMEVQVGLTPAATNALPVDFDSIRSLGILGYAPMDQLSLSDFYALRNDPNGNPIIGQPVKFAIVADKLAFWPTADKAYTVNMTYRANLPALSLVTQTNWLLARRPDLYLFASLLHAEFYGWNDARLPLLKSAVDEMLGETMMAGVRRRYGSGPLTMKPATSERIGLRQ